MPRKTAVEASRGTTFRLPPEGLKVITDEKHPLYDPRVNLPINEGLVLSIMVVGFKSVLKVWKDGSDLYVIDGMQRWKAAIEANRRFKAEKKETVEVEFQLERGDDGDVFGVAVTLNENRQDANPIERARKASRLYAMGRAPEYIAAVYGWTVPQYRAHMALLVLARPVQDAVAADRIKLSAAAQLAKLTRDEQQTKLAELLAEGGKATVARVKKIVKGQKAADKIAWRPRGEIKKVAERMRGTTFGQGSAAVSLFAEVVAWIMGELDAK